MNAIDFSRGENLQVVSHNNQILFKSSTKEGKEFSPVIKGLIGANGINPMLYRAENGGLWLFYTNLLSHDEATSQIKAAYAHKNEYSAKEIAFRFHDVIYPRLGGSFTDERQSAGVNEKEDEFSPELIRRYVSIYEKLKNKEGFSEETFKKYIDEKSKLALGKLYGVKIADNNYPFARRIGFSLRGMPIEIEYKGRNCIVLPVYSEIFNCIVLLYSFDNGLNFDSKDYIVCHLKQEDSLVLKKENSGIKLVKKSNGKIYDVGFTSDLGQNWQNLYEATDFIFKTDSLYNSKHKKQKFRTMGIKVFGKPNPKRFFEILKNITKNEDVFGFISRKKTVLTSVDFAPKPISNLKGYEIPIIEDVFLPIKEHAHGSGIVSLPDGELICVWFQSDGERKGNDGRILAARKPVSGDWQKPFIIADVKGLADCNPTIYLDKNEKLWFFWYPVLSNAWETSQSKFMYADKGNYEYVNGYADIPKWTGYGTLDPGHCNELQGKALAFKNGKYLYGQINGECRYISEKQFKENPIPKSQYVKIEDRYITDPFVVALRNSTIDTIKYIRKGRKYAALTPVFEIYLWWEARRICKYASGADSNYKKWKPIKRALGWQTKNKPIEFEFEGKNRMLLPLYTDGIHCSLAAFTDDEGKTWDYSLPFASIAPEQGANIMLSNGILRTYFRSSEPEKHVISYESLNGGKTFENLIFEKDLLHQGGFDIVKVKDDLWLMSITRTHIAKGINKGNRSLLEVAVSKDEGKTWQHSPLEFDESGLRSYHYSAITCNKAGDVFISYSYDDENGLNSIRCASIYKKATH